MQIVLLVMAVIGFGAYTTWLLATSIPERMLVRSGRHGRYADLGSEPQEVIDAAPQRAAGKRRIDQVSSLNSR